MAHKGSSLCSPESSHEHSESSSSGHIAEMLILHEGRRKPYGNDCKENKQRPKDDRHD